MSRAPVRIVALEPDPDSFLVIGGRRYAGVNASVSKETFEAMLEGYVCALCYERQDEPFPEVCKAEWCPMEIRAKQTELLAQLYQGERWIGPRTSHAENEEQMQEDLLRMRHEKRSRILLPPKH